MSSLFGIHMVKPWKCTTQFNSHTPKRKTSPTSLFACPTQSPHCLEWPVEWVQRINIKKLGRRETNQGDQERVRSRVREKARKLDLGSNEGQVLQQGAYWMLFWILLVEFKWMLNSAESSEKFKLEKWSMGVLIQQKPFQWSGGSRNPIRMDWRECSERKCHNMCTQMFQEALLRMGNWREMWEKGNVFWKLFKFRWEWFNC